jgi:signal transduction histidine kinase
MYYPSLIPPIDNSQVLFEHIQSLIITAFFLGIVIKFQEAIYLREKKKADESMRQMKETDAWIKKQDSLLATINSVASILLKSDPADFENDLWRCLGMIAQTVQVDKVYIWKNHITGGELRTSFLYEWSEDSSPSKNKDTRIDIPYTEIPGWDKLSRGQCYGDIAKNLSPEAKVVYESQGIISFFMVPAFLRDLFWGFVGFDDCRHERFFSAEEEAMLRSGSLLIANAMQRNEMMENLIRAREEALSSTRAKSDFLANMSHEMRTPMNAIIGMTNIAKGAEKIDRKDYCLSKIEEASSHLLGVINDVLDMSKIEANKFELSNSEFNFEKVLQGVVNVINFRVEEKKQQLTVTVGPNIPQVLFGDEQRLTQVITNLLSNAVKFTPEEGSIRLESSFLGEEEDGTCTIKIVVQDSGIGIGEEEQQRLFNSFEQADSNTSRKYGGTGLGLAISKRIVEMMGGTIGLESEPGKGSAFFFTVKMCRGHIAEAETSDADEEQPAAAPAVFPGQRILLAEDVEINREIVLALLEDTELTIDCAENGAEAVQKFIEAPDAYGMIFMDLQMPEMDGYEATKRIRAWEAENRHDVKVFPKRIPIIAMTANVFKEDVEKCLASGMNGHVGKPLDFTEVLSQLQKYLQSQ